AMSQAQMQLTEVDLTGVIDLHIHTAPDVSPRKMDDVEAARQAAARGMRAILLKSHATLTAGRAELVERMVPGIHMFGGLALNDAVGGLNPSAVEAALRLGAVEIWMPTLSARGDPRPYRATGLSVLDGDGLVPVIEEILRLIAEHDAILGTGHLSPAEIMLFVPAAREAGVR